nr:hypothetical protein CFP56_33613 [Quercus suber]
MPRAVHYLWPPRLLQKYRTSRVAVEGIGLEQQLREIDGGVVRQYRTPRLGRLRRAPYFRWWKWGIIYTMMTVITVLFCVLAVIHRLLGRLNGSLTMREELPPVAIRSPFVCGLKRAHWECTARFQGPKAANVENHFTVQEWLDEYCVWQDGEMMGFWLCGEKVGFDYGVPGGEGTWVEKVSDQPMGQARQKHHKPASNNSTCSMRD